MAPAPASKPAAAPSGGWLYISGGQRQGPVSQEQLQHLAKSGRLQPTDKVFRQGMPQPVEAQTVPGLFPSAPLTLQPAAEPGVMDLQFSQVEEAAPRPSHDGFAKRFFSECIAIVVATFQQTIKPLSFVFGKGKGKKLRQRAEETQLLLGQRLYEIEHGDAKLRGKIRMLGERVHSIQAVKGDAREPLAERKDLLLKLADPMLAGASAPDAIEGEHARARDAKAKLDAHEESMKGALGGLLPANATGWRRIAIGYSICFCFFLVFAAIFAAIGHSVLVAQNDKNAKLAAEQKRAADDEEDRREKKTVEIVERCGPSVALIRFKDDGGREGGGTGFMIRPGILATNAHVIDSVLINKVKIYYPSSPNLGKTPFSARVLHFDPKRDLAFLAVEPKVPPLKLAREFEFKSGQAITVIGCPGIGEKQLENAVNTGVMSTKTDLSKQNYYQMGISVNPGNSGGPVFDSRGQVVGVVTLKADREGIAFCIPWHDLKSGIETLEKKDQNKAAAEGTGRHNLFVAVGRVVGASRVYLGGMRIYVRRMSQAMAQGRSANEGMANGRREFDQMLRQIDSETVNEEIRTLAQKARTDPNVSTEIRSKYDDLWKTYQELKDYVEKPRGTFATYADKQRELENRLKREIQALAEAYGFIVDDEKPE
jgi:S1-C subfamily serine protease